MGSVSGAAVGPVAGALLGSFVGGLIGKAFRKHRWEVASIEELRVDISPQRGGTFSVGLTVRIGEQH